MDCEKVPVLQHPITNSCPGSYLSSPPRGSAGSWGEVRISFSFTVPKSRRECVICEILPATHVFHDNNSITFLHRMHLEIHTRYFTSIEQAPDEPWWCCHGPTDGALAHFQENSFALMRLRLLLVKTLYEVEELKNEDITSHLCPLTPPPSPWLLLFSLSTCIYYEHYWECLG